MESIGSRSHICETELGSAEDEEDMYYSDPEGPHIDEPIAYEEWLTEYNRELERTPCTPPGYGPALYAKTALQLVLETMYNINKCNSSNIKKFFLALHYYGLLLLWRLNRGPVGVPNNGS